MSANCKLQTEQTEKQSQIRMMGEKPSDIVCQPKDCCKIQDWRSTLNCLSELKASTQYKSQRVNIRVVLKILKGVWAQSVRKISWATDSKAKVYCAVANILAWGSGCAVFENSIWPPATFTTWIWYRASLQPSFNMMQKSRRRHRRVNRMFQIYRWRISH